MHHATKHGSSALQNTPAANHRTISSPPPNPRRDRAEKRKARKSEQPETDTTDTEDSFPSAHATRALFVSAHIIVKGSEWRCAHRYEAGFHLARPNSKVQIGELVCHVVERSGAQVTWAKEILTSRKGDQLSEVQNILRALFTDRGRLRKHLDKYKAALAGDKLLVIDTFRLERPYRGTGLAQDAIAAFLDGLKKVRRHGAGDEDWTFDGPVVLSPAADGTEKRKLQAIQANGEIVDDVVVERKLIKSWEKSGFEIWVLGDERVEGSVSVMGRVEGDGQP